MMPSGFNAFGHLPAVIPPMPVPEPPRVINPRPLVPDLSWCSDLSSVISPRVKVSPEQRQHQRTPDYSHQVTEKRPSPDRFKTIYPRSPPKPVSPPKNRFKVSFQPDAAHQQHVFETPKLKEVFGSRKTACTNGNTLAKNVVVRHQNQQRSPTNEEMYEILKQQDQQLQKISEQIQELLQIHKIQEIRQPPTVGKKPVEQRSVMTMTSLVLSKHRSSPLHKSTPKTPSTASKELRQLKMPTICESPTNESVDIDVRQLDLSETNNSANDRSGSSVEACRNRDPDDDYYDNMMDNINFMLNSSASASEGRRSSCSATPPMIPSPSRHHQRRNEEYQLHVHSEQTLYIKRLADKYLVGEGQAKQSRNKVKERHRNEFLLRDELARDLNTYGLTRNASIATKNYLEKYGLTFNGAAPPRVAPRNERQDAYRSDQHHHQQHQRYQNQHQNHYPHRHHRQLSSSQRILQSQNRILDIEALQRQPKLT